MIPKTMRAVVFDHTGAPDVLSIVERPVPALGPGEVLIKVAATAMNFADLLQRQGNYSNHADLNPILGLECSGVVVAQGDGVALPTIGTEVCALLNGGGYAEYVCAKVGQVLPIPSGIAVTNAAVLPEAACTVWSNVLDLAALSPNESLLVHGGAGGVGSLAIQVASALGVEVFATAGTPEKLEYATRIGARHVINYHDNDFVGVIREISAGRGVDVILDVIGPAYLGRNIEALAFDGRMTMIGLQSGREGTIPLGMMMKKRATLFTTSLRDRPLAAKDRIAKGVKTDIWPLVSAAKVLPLIDCRFPLADIVEAHRYMESGRHLGKILIEVQ